MGVRTAVTDRNRPNLRLVRYNVDIWLLLILFAIVVCGLLALYSASWDFSRAVYDKDAYYIFRRQLLFLSGGLGVAAFAAYLDYRKLQKLSVALMGIVTVALIGVIIVSEVRLGAARTLLNGSVQPSEFAKVITVMYLAFWLNSKREHLNKLTFGLLPLGVILGVTGGLIYLQPDLSAVLTIMAIGGVMFFLADVDMKQIALVAVVAVLAGTAASQFSRTGQDRISEYLAGLNNPEAASYHVQRSLEAFVSGGWFGQGFGQAISPHTGLPVPSTDSIYAVIGEEFGVLGATIVLLLYVALLWRGLKVAQRAPDMLGRLLAGGMTIWVTFEAMLNMAVILGLLPFAGNALPFISSGGSSLLTSLVAMGIVVNVSWRSEMETQEKATRYTGVVDLKNRRDTRPSRWSTEQRVSKPIGNFEQRPVGTKMATQNRKSRRTKRSQKE